VIYFRAGERLNLRRSPECSIGTAGIEDATPLKT
jgi:hypothetical protein